MFYGGWGDYQLWADHDFRPRASVEGTAQDEEPSRTALPPPRTPPTDSRGRLLPLAPPPAPANSDPWPVARSNQPADNSSWPALPINQLTGTTVPPPDSGPPEPTRDDSPADSGSWPVARSDSPAAGNSWPAQPISPLAGKEPPPPPVSGEPRRLVRPYTRTGGRTRQSHRLELETLLSTPVGREADVATLRADLRAICVACRMPQSTAEVAVRLGLPLGAARVLIGDVVDLGMLYVHENVHTGEQGPSMDLLNRVYAGLRNLA